mgnify:CR=1 FL=1
MRIASSYLRRRARIEIIPLIDIIFFLLATFMMVSLAMVKNKAMPINLPSAKMASPVAKEEIITLTVTRDGLCYWDKEKVEFHDLSKKLNELKNSLEDPKIMVSADEQVFFGQAVAILDEIRKAGITKIAIQTKDE